MATEALPPEAVETDTDRLRSVLDLGDRLLDALGAGDVEAVVRLTTKRGAAVEALLTGSGRPTLDPSTRDRARRQDVRLREALADRVETSRVAVAQAGRASAAHAGYAPDVRPAALDTSSR